MGKRKKSKKRKKSTSSRSRQQALKREQIEENKFIVYQHAGTVKAILGYPTKAIFNMINRMG